MCVSDIYQLVEAECEVEKDVVIVFQRQSHTGQSIHIANQLYHWGQGVKHPNVVLKHRDSVKIKYKSSFPPSVSCHVTIYIGIKNPYNAWHCQSIQSTGGHKNFVTKSVWNKKKKPHHIYKITHIFKFILLGVNKI